MPSRCACLLILVLWLASMGWLFQREIWPWLQPDIPPPYTIDLVDEARHQAAADIHWSVYLEKDRPMPRLLESQPVAAATLFGLTSDQHVGPLWGTSLCRVAGQRPPFKARTSVKYEERPDDSFLFRMELVPPSLGERGHQATPPQLDLGTSGPISAKLNRMESSYRVNRQGQLLALDVKFEAGVTIHLFGAQTINGIKAELDGKVVDSKFQGHYKVSLPANIPLPPDVGKRLEGDIQPVTLSYNGSVLCPYHPVNRIRGLRPGQKWRVPLVNPVEEVIQHSFLGSNQKPRFIDAHVLPQPQLLPDSEQPIRCLVIEYDSEELQPRTFVQQNTGLVLRQEALVSGGQRLIIQRDPPFPREP